MAYLMGIDVGTSGTKTLLVDESGNLVASVNHEYPLSTPQPLWAEQDPLDWWEATKEGIRGVLAKAEVSPDSIAGIGLSGQMHGLVLLDRNHEVLRPAILWCDQRTSEQCSWITDTVGKETVVEETRNPVLTGFTAPKIIWVRDKEPQIYDRTVMMLLPKDYIRFRLTGEFATEVSDASGTSLLNVPERRWSKVVLDKIQISEDHLPRVFESSVISGKITKQIAQETGLREGTPVVGGGGDQAAGAVGNGIVRRGVISVTTGTSGVVFAFSDQPTVDPKLRVHTFCHAVPNKWHVMGVMLSAGGSLRWFRDTLCSEETGLSRRIGRDPYEFITAQAEHAPVGSEGLIFLPYLTGERTPYPDPEARGVFFGLTLRHHKGHLARSVLEGVAYGLRDSLEILKEMNVPLEEVRASGGGARSELWRQIQTDVNGIPLSTINVDEGPALGVALLAGVGAGIYGSIEEACDRAIRTVSMTEVNQRHHSIYSDYYRIYGSLYQSLKGQFAEVGSVLSRWHS
ncbi:MAG: xylulokinase [Armatimonadetes bacterium]|nr:xylulokinase [Armatimonadota bacterium]